MKIRNGFVSNSSSSSFICDVTGGIESGWDATLSDIGMCCCREDHTFYEDYRLPVGDNLAQDIVTILKDEMIHYKNLYENGRDSYKEDYESAKREYEEVSQWSEEKILDNYDEGWIDEQSEGGYELPSLYCPICQLVEVSDSDLIAYLIKVTGLSKEQLKQDIKNKFENYKKLKEYLT
jgi:hypothetical protein